MIAGEVGWRSEFLQEHNLPVAYLDMGVRFLDPLAMLCAQRAQEKSGTLLVACNGSQGSGKSTGCDYLRRALSETHDVSAIALSIDDFYLTRAQRQELAVKVHPLLLTRGVPGTHDLALMRSTLQSLQDPGSGTVFVPQFDKSRDDRRSPADWPEVAAPVQVVILEGWCLGACSEAVPALRDPINDLEAKDDPEGIWREYVNQQLRLHYEPLYPLFDLWIMLAAGDFEQVLSWRREQETKLRDRVRGSGSGLMDDAALQRFVDHFERITRACLRDLPQRVDVCLRLDSERAVTDVRGLGA